MGMTYGPGLLNSIPSHCIATTEQKLALLDDFARQGFILECYEVIDDTVVKFIDGVPKPKEAVLYQWVEDEEKTSRVKALMRRSGSLPYSHFNFLEDFFEEFNMLVPDIEAHGQSALALVDGTKFEFSAIPIPWAIEGIQKVNEDISAYDASYWEKEHRSLAQYLEFHHKLIRDLTNCMNEGVIYMLNS